MNERERGGREEWRNERGENERWEVERREGKKVRGRNGEKDVSVRNAR